MPQVLAGVKGEKMVGGGGRPLPTPKKVMLTSSKVSLLDRLLKTTTPRILDRNLDKGYLLYESARHHYHLDFV